jgi:hypothetical protein
MSLSLYYFVKMLNNHTVFGSVFTRNRSVANVFNSVILSTDFLIQ